MKCRNRIDVRTEDGFTLAELVIALGLMSVVLAVMVAFFMTLIRSSVAQNAAAGAQHSARAGVEHRKLNLMTGPNPIPVLWKAKHAAIFRESC